MEYHSSKTPTTTDLTKNESISMFDKKKVFRMISWNIDGLSEKNIKLRTDSVCKYIKQIDSDIVFFQEVVAESQAILEEQLKNYSFIFGSNSKAAFDYYSAIGLKKSRIVCKYFEIIEFKHTDMNRNIISANVTLDGLKLFLMNTHLESTKQGAFARKKQLKECFDLIQQTDKEYSLIFGGDLNLHDSEICEVGQLPTNTHDLWILGGSRKECRYTWDLTRNDNLKMTGSFKNNFHARFRFDRLYYRPSEPSKFELEYFGLIGLERLKPHVCFPSDHWGILTSFVKSESFV